MTYAAEPENFNPRFEIAACFMEHGGKILLLHRKPDKSQGGKWGVPAGKIDRGEDILDALIREIREETGITIQKENVFYLSRTYHRYPEHDFVFHAFGTGLKDLPEVKINPREHQAYDWKTPPEYLEMDMIDDMGDVVRKVYNLPI